MSKPIRATDERSIADREERNIHRVGGPGNLATKGDPTASRPAVSSAGGAVVTRCSISEGPK